jgi:flagellin
MGLRIRTNVASIAAQRHLNQTTESSKESMAKLSSGYRINKSADDAAGLAISENWRAGIRSLNQAKRNASDAVSFIEVTEGSMNEVSSILIRLRELAIQTSSDTIGDVERSFANREYIQLVDEIDRISNVSEFNGYKMLGGAEKNDGVEEITFHIGKGDGLIPNTDTILLNMEDFKLNAEEVLGLGKQSEIGALEVSDQPFRREDAAMKIAVIDTAINRVANNRATLGSKQSRLNSTITNLAISIENAQSSNSRIRDVDYADEMANFTQQKILSQAGVSVLSQANTMPEVVLSLLR